VEMLGDASNSFLATVGLRIEPAPVDSGVRVRLDVAVTTMPLYVYKAVEEFRRAIEAIVEETLEHGLFGWRVTDCTVTLTHSGYTSPATTSADFRKLVPMVLVCALRQAGTVVCEPIQHFRIEVPIDTLGSVLPLLARLQAVPQAPVPRGSSYTVEGDIPAAREHELQEQLPSLTRGEGVLDTVFDRYRPIALSK
jgi:ribosomal protection tetracycline resistance protein